MQYVLTVVVNGRWSLLQVCYNRYMHKATGVYEMGGIDYVMST